MSGMNFDGSPAVFNRPVRRRHCNRSALSKLQMPIGFAAPGEKVQNRSDSLITTPNCKPALQWSKPPTYSFRELRPRVGLTQAGLKSRPKLADWKSAPLIVQREPSYRRSIHDNNFHNMGFKQTLYLVSKVATAIAAAPSKRPKAPSCSCVVALTET
jgi:hypothetical protein